MPTLVDSGGAGAKGKWINTKTYIHHRSIVPTPEISGPTAEVRPVYALVEIVLSVSHDEAVGPVLEGADHASSPSSSRGGASALQPEGDGRAVIPAGQRAGEAGRRHAKVHPLLLGPVHTHCSGTFLWRRKIWGISYKKIILQFYFFLWYSRWMGSWVGHSSQWWVGVSFFSQRGSSTPTGEVQSSQTQEGRSLPRRDVGYSINRDNITRSRRYMRTMG